MTANWRRASASAASTSWWCSTSCCQGATALPRCATFAVRAKAGWDHYTKVGGPETGSGHVDVVAVGVGLQSR